MLARQDLIKHSLARFPVGGPNDHFKGYTFTEDEYWLTLLAISAHQTSIEAAQL
ncbi:MAG: hypothetical protein ACE5R6_09440 [Candidatus Heimdallarchaeota archaeon]